MRGGREERLGSSTVWTSQQKSDTCFNSIGRRHLFCCEYKQSSHRFRLDSFRKVVIVISLNLGYNSISLLLIFGKDRSRSGSFASEYRFGVSCERRIES